MIDDTAQAFTNDGDEYPKYVLFAEYKGPMTFWNQPIFPEDLPEIVTDGENTNTVEGMYFWLSCPMDESVLHGMECQADGTWTETPESLLAKPENLLFCKTEEEIREIMSGIIIDVPQIGGHTLLVTPETLVPEVETVTIAPQPEQVTTETLAPAPEESITFVEPLQPEEIENVPEETPETEHPEETQDEDTQAAQPAGELEQADSAVATQGMSTPVIIGIAGGSFALLSCGGLAWYLRRKLCNFEEESKNEYERDLELGDLRDAVNRNVKAIQDHSAPKEIFSDVVHGSDFGVAAELNDEGEVAVDFDDNRSVATYKSFVENLVARSPAIFRLWEKYDIEHLGSETGLKKIEHMHTNVKH